MNKGIFFSFLTWTILMVACDCEDCGPAVFNPTFQAQFINTDSVELLTDSLEVLTEEQTILADTISNLTTFIGTLEDADSIITYSSIQSSFSDTKTIIDSLITRVSENEDSVSLGYLIISEIRNLENGESYQPDTTNLFDIPLPLAEGTNTASFEFTILGESYTLDVSFEAEESLDVLGDIELEISDFTVDKSTMTFDSLITLDGPIYQFQF